MRSLTVISLMLKSLCLLRFPVDWQLATAGSTVRRGALFGFENPTRFAWDQYVPAIDLDVIVGTSVDPEATGVEDWLAAMVAGITVSSVLIRPTNGSGELLTNVLTSEETFRK